MQFKQGTNVYTANGDQVGVVDRVVIDPVSKEVTHLVVQRGLLFTEDKVVQLSMVDSATEDGVTLRESADDLKELPDFEETLYIPAEPRRVPAEQDTRPEPDTYWAYPLYWYPPIGPWWTANVYAGYAMPKYFTMIEQNIPEGMVALKEGARVISSDGEHIGDIERILADSLENRATHLLISKGMFLKNVKLIPSGWVTNVFEDEIHLAVASDLVESLAEYHPQD